MMWDKRIHKCCCDGPRRMLLFQWQAQRANDMMFCRSV